MTPARAKWRSQMLFKRRQRKQSLKLNRPESCGVVRGQQNIRILEVIYSLVDAVGIELSTKRTFNNMQVSG